MEKLSNQRLCHANATSLDDSLRGCPGRTHRIFQVNDFDEHPYNSCRTILAPSTNEQSLPKATSRGKYFMPQSGARIRRSGSTYCKAERILPATVSGVPTSISPRLQTTTMLVFCAN